MRSTSEFRSRSMTLLMRVQVLSNTSSPHTLTPATLYLRLLFNLNFDKLNLRYP